MDQNKIGKFILELRKEKNMSQKELAQKIGVTDRAISKWENGRGMPDLSLMKPLCKELDITINDLLSGERIDKKDYQSKLEENILNTINYSNQLLIKSLLFYISVFASGIFIIPTLGIIAPIFMLCGLLAPICGLIKLIGYIFHIEIPFIMFQIGKYELNPISSFILSIITGLILYFIGKYSWHLLLKYINKVKEKAQKLEN